MAKKVTPFREKLPAVAGGSAIATVPGAVIGGGVTAAMQPTGWHYGPEHHVDLSGVEHVSSGFYQYDLYPHVSALNVLHGAGVGAGLAAGLVAGGAVLHHVLSKRQFKKQQAALGEK
jgi:hypothetical protein